MIQSTANSEALPPQPPEKPLPTDCCGGGCDRCVYDLYDEAMERFQLALEEWQRRQSIKKSAGEGA